jgi:hypothetical protein
MCGKVVQKQAGAELFQAQVQVDLLAEFILSLISDLGVFSNVVLGF